MEENTLENEIINIGENDAQDNGQALDNSQDNGEPQVPETPKQEPQEAQELWKQTKQFEQGLWKNPDDIYNSVKYYEQKFQPLEQTLKRMGYKEPAEFEQAFKEYNDNLPVYKQNAQTIEFLNALLQDEVYGSKIRGVFDEIRRQREMQRYGIAFDELPEVLREKVTKGEQAFQQLEEMKQQQAVSENQNIINAQIEKVQKTAEEYGVEVDIQQLLQHCLDNQINPNYIYSEFLQSNMGQLLTNAKANASASTLQQNKQNKAKAVNSSTKQAAPPAQNVDSVKELQNAILEKL